SAGLGPDDIDAALIRRARITYLEGYLWDPPRAKEAFRRAIAMAHEHGRLVALTLSDAFCVERYRSEFLELIAEDVDILFANEAEIKVLHHAPNFDAALQHLRGRRLTAALTRSEKGSVIVHGDALHVVDAAPVARVVDTTGAGDLFAAGFLFGCARGNTLYDAARIGSMAAAEVISHYGARPEAALRERLGELFR
ncbi:MAG: adenosine kinase, partial [Alphaproteobacteria bacterium]|nr:adenosine kinase [Alphaproteobacteria bacterium]